MSHKKWETMLFSMQELVLISHPSITLSEAHNGLDLGQE